MNQGPNPPTGNAGGKGRRRRRRRGAGAPHQPNQPPAKSQGQGQGQPQGQGQSQADRRASIRVRPSTPADAASARSGPADTRVAAAAAQRPSQREPLGGVYSAPMDHSYRAVLADHDGNVHIARPQSSGQALRRSSRTRPDCARRAYPHLCFRGRPVFPGEDQRDRPQAGRQS